MMLRKVKRNAAWLVRCLFRPCRHNLTTNARKRRDVRYVKIACRPHNEWYAQNGIDPSSFALLWEALYEAEIEKARRRRWSKTVLLPLTRLHNGQKYLEEAHPPRDRGHRR